LTGSNNKPPQNLPTGSMMNLSDAEYLAVRNLVYDKFGVNLTEQKRSLIVGRLQKVIKQEGLNSFQEYIDLLTSDPTGQKLVELVNRITTNHTFFMREKDHFDFFTDTVLPETAARLKTQNSNDLRVWCAGCSSGEEAYTLLILIAEFFGIDLKNWDAGLLATDISQKALNIAKTGVYSDERLKDFPKHLLQKYFTRLDDINWQVKDIYRNEITFRGFNLMNKSFPFKKPFDVIFCRNVMIYFDQPTRKRLVDSFYQFTNPGGYLFIGHSESLRREECPYTYIKPAVYKKV
jgi:chemotaxis protein methyltransferase CheR